MHTKQNALPIASGAASGCSIPRIGRKANFNYCQYPYNSAKRTREQSKLDLEKAAKIYESAEIWPSYLILQCSETKAKVNVFCINCDFEDRRDWQGRIMGRVLHGALSAILARIKHKSR